MSDPKQPGEGNREADRRYREKTRDFVENENVREKAREAEPGSKAEAERLKKAEEKGEDKAREKDPAVQRDYSAPEN
ncbi:MAG: hypothetical protein P8080_13635 [Gammaproteobacteria bacterium]